MRVPTVAGMSTTPCQDAPEPPPDGSGGAAPRGPGNGEDVGGVVVSELATRLEETPAGALLASLVEALDVDALSAYELVELAAAADRVESWAHRHKVAAAGALVGRDDLQPRSRPVSGRAALEARQQVAATLAMRLQRPVREGDALVREALSYEGVLAGTGEALASGDIDPGRARVLVDRLWDQPVPVAAAVEADVLPVAPGRTSGQLRRDVERSLVRHDGVEASVRARAARERRCVSRPRALGDGMASFWVLLPAVQAVRVDRVLDAAARAARATGDGRTLDQVRADELCALITGEADLDLDGTPAPGAVRPDAQDGAEAVDDADRASVTTRGRAPQTVVHVTVGLSTLIGLDDQPGDLEGYGPVDAVQARALALGGVWRRLLTDPLSGTLLDVGRTRYRPPAALDEHVRLRDRYCTAPGCLVPAVRTDLDHTDPWDGDRGSGPPGSTSADNLGPGCRFHHRLKTEGGFTVRQLVPGQFDWGTPTGHVFRTRPGAEHPAIRLGRDADHGGGIDRARRRDPAAPGPPIAGEAIGTPEVPPF